MTKFEFIKYKTNKKIRVLFKNPTSDIFVVGQFVEFTRTSKCKGYARVIKRHNFSMQDATHGNSLAHRAHGSIGPVSYTHLRAHET